MNTAIDFIKVLDTQYASMNEWTLLTTDANEKCVLRQDEQVDWLYAQFGEGEVVSGFLLSGYSYIAVWNTSGLGEYMENAMGFVPDCIYKTVLDESIHLYSIT